MVLAFGALGPLVVAAAALSRGVLVAAAGVVVVLAILLVFVMCCVAVVTRRATRRAGLTMTPSRGRWASHTPPRMSQAPVALPGLAPQWAKWGRWAAWGKWVAWGRWGRWVAWGRWTISSIRWARVVGQPCRR